MPVSLRKMETWHCKGQQGGIVMLHFFFVTLGCHFHINVRKYDVCFLHLKLPISCWNKDRAHPYLGYAVLVNDRNLHCHINNVWSVRFDPSGSTVFTSTIFRSTVRRNFNCIPGYPDKTKVKHISVHRLPRWHNERILLSLQETQETRVQSWGQEDPLE